MKQKYCPYCDQKMTSGLYCSGCKRIVWHPYVQDVDYYLNESMSQTACTMMAEANTREAERPAQIRTRAYLKEMGHRPAHRAERKRQIGRRRQRIHSRIWETG